MHTWYIYIYVYTYAWFIYIYIGGWRGDTNKETISSRSCVRTRGLVVEWNVASNVRERLPFSLFYREPFPCPLWECSAFSWVPVSSVISSEFHSVQWFLLSSGEFQWCHVKSSEIKQKQVQSTEIKWNQRNKVKSSETKWNQVKSSGTKWKHSLGELKWRQVKSSETTRIQMKPNEIQWK